MDSEFVKLLSPALKTERGIEINICIFILLLQISDGASQAKGWPLLCMLLGEVSITHRTQGFQPPPNTTCLGPGGAERTQHPLPMRCCPCHRLPRSSARSRGNLRWERRAERTGSGSFNSCTHSHASRGAREPRKAPPSIRTAFPTEQPWPKAGRTQGSGRKTRALSRQDTARTPAGHLQDSPCLAAMTKERSAARSHARGRGSSCPVFGANCRNHHFVPAPDVFPKVPSHPHQNIPRGPAHRDEVFN